MLAITRLITLVASVLVITGSSNAFDDPIPFELDLT